MEMYFLKSAACLAILLLFYKLLLERENMHVFKRFYLLASVVAAIAIPAITFTTYIEPSSETFKQVWMSSETVSETVSINYWPNVILGIYIMGVIFFSIKFFRNLRDLILKIKKNQKIRENDITNVLLSEKTPPHTFFHYIFFNKEKYLCNEIPGDVKIHEEAHARQKHSIDVIFIELLQIIFWINPLIFLLKNAIKLNHEFLADRAVICHGYRTSEYQKTLLSYSSGDLQSDLVNPINYSSIKKRFTVMKTKTSQNAIWTRMLFLLPLLAILLYGFSTREIVAKDSQVISSIILPDNETLEIDVDKKGVIFINNKRVSIEQLKKMENGKYTYAGITASPKAPQPILDELVEVLLSKGAKKVTLCTSGDFDNIKYNKSGSEQQKATPEEMAEYNRLVKHYNNIPGDKRVVKQEDANKIMAILGKMSPDQKEKAEKINFDVPPPPPPAPAPTPANGGVPAPLPPPVEVIGYPAPPSPPAPPAGSKEKLSPPVKVTGYPSPPPPPLEEIVVQGYPSPPPPPPPPSYKDLVEKGAIFYYNDKLITPEEARQLVEVEKKVNVQITDIDKKPIVKLTDKKEKK